MMSFSMIISELEEFLTLMKGEKYLGLIFSVFTLSAALSRLWSGKLADIIGRKKIILFGTLVTAICGGIYIFTSTITAFFILRFIHGLSTGWRPTGSTTLLIDIAPPARMGEAMGILGVAGSSGMALGPALGSFLKEDFGFEPMFICSSIFGVIALLLSMLLKESHPVERKMKISDLNIFKGKTLDWSTKMPSIITLLDTFSFGVIITTAPIIVANLGFKYKGLFHLVFVSASILTRIFSGKSSDRYGRVKMLKIGLLLLAVALLIIGFSVNQFMVVTGAIVLGVSIGINRPTVFAWTADLADPKNRAASMATMLLALEIGIGAGALISGTIYNAQMAFETICLSYIISATFAIFAFLILLRYEKKISHK